MFGNFSYPRMHNAYPDTDSADYYYALAAQHQREAEIALFKAQEALDLREQQALEQAYIKDLYKHHAAINYPGDFYRPYSRPQPRIRSESLIRFNPLYDGIEVDDGFMRAFVPRELSIDQLANLLTEQDTLPSQRGPKSTAQAPGPTTTRQATAKNVAENFWSALSSTHPEVKKAQPFGRSAYTFNPARHSQGEPPKRPQSRKDISEQEPTRTSQQELTASLSLISTLEAQFHALQSSFEFPEHVDFNSVDSSDAGDHSDSDSGVSSSSATPPLSYSIGNKPLRAYENSLGDLLVKIDEVESHGDEGVRETRRNLVRSIEAELETVDQKKVAAWMQHVETEKAEALGASISVQWDSESEQEHTREQEHELETRSIATPSHTLPGSETIEKVDPADPNTPVVSFTPDLSTDSHNARVSVGLSGASAIAPPQQTATPNTVLSDITPSSVSYRLQGTSTDYAVRIDSQSAEITLGPSPTSVPHSMPAEHTTQVQDLPLDLAANQSNLVVSTGPKRRPVTIEEVEDEDYEML